MTAGTFPAVTRMTSVCARLMVRNLAELVQRLTGDWFEEGGRLGVG